jgi:hypothetical protein
LKLEIIEAATRFHLHGKSSSVQDNRFGEVGMKLMDEMWKLVKNAGTATTGINHWVYLPDGNMFVGVELLPNAKAPDGLEPLHFELQRFLKHLHVGPYQALPAKWKALKDDLSLRGECICSPSLEIYGHHCEDPTKLETTILIGIKTKVV